MARTPNPDNPHAKIEAEYRKLEGHYRALEALAVESEGAAPLARDMAARILAFCEAHADVAQFYAAAPRWAGRIAQAEYTQRRKKAGK